MGRYPHLLKHDAVLWDDFLLQFPNLHDYYDYDIRVGNGRDPGDDFASNIRDMAIRLSQRRIDAVGHSPDRIDVIEITGQAGLTALGQLHAYPILYRQTFNVSKPIFPLLVCRSFATDAQQAFDNAKIPYFVIAP